MTRIRSRLVMVCAFLGILIPALSVRAAVDFRSIARLSGSPTLTGKAVYIEKTINATLMQRFQVELFNGIPTKVYAVRVNGTLVGSVTIGPLGTGKMELRTAQFISDPEEDPIPPGFPHLDTGDVVTVGPMAGVFFDTMDTSLQRYRLLGSFTGAGSTEGTVKYKERYDDGVFEREFEVEIEHSTPGQVFNVVVKNKVVGQITINSLGRGRLDLHTGINMPASFPTLKDGDTVNIGSIVVTLATN